MTRRRIMAGCAALGALALGVAAPLLSGATGGGGSVAQSVLGSGDQTSEAVQQALDGLYLFSPGCQAFPPSGTAWYDFSCKSPDPTGTITTENYEHDQVHEATWLSSDAGIAQLCQQGQTGVAHIDYARSARRPTSTDCAGLRSVAYALDGLSWEAFDGGTTASGIHGMSNTSSPCASGVCLTQAQLQGIFLSCTITNWNQVGGQNVPISIYTAMPGTGTRANWDRLLGGDSSRCIPAGQLSSRVIAANSNLGVPASDQAGAIVPFSTGVWNTGVNTGLTGRGGAVLGALDGVTATTTTVGNGTFPFTSYLYNVYCSAACPGGASSTAAVNYVGEDGWICKPAASHATNPVTGNNYRTDIANSITNAGFAPLPSGTVGGGDTSTDFCRLQTAPQPAGDFDGDQKADLTVYRPSTGVWYTQYSSGIPYSGTAWGEPNGSDITASADFDGTGKAQIAVFRPSTGVWYILHANGSYTATVWGISGDVPVPADYDGVGRAQIAVYRPSTGVWYILHAGGGYTATTWGAGNDIPVPADYDGAGRKQIAVYRQTTGVWYILHAGGGYTATTWGAPNGGDIPTPADYDGTGHTQIAVFRPSTGVWYVLHAGGTYAATVWGQSGDIPEPSDYNADGKAEIAVYRPGSSGTWYVLLPGGSYTQTVWGTTGDQPVVLPAAIRSVFFP